MRPSSDTLADSPACSHAAIPLVSDLDGTLLRTDTLWEGLVRLLRQRPWAALRLAGWLRLGRLAFKLRLAPFAAAGAAGYPVNEPVRDYLQSAAEDGRELCLATASPEPVAKAACTTTGLPFSRILSSDETTNLKGEAKARLLCETFGEKGFDYIGDSLVDVPVWRTARRAVVASADAEVIAAARAANPDCEVLPAARPRLRDYARALRAHQWVKNLLVFVPLLLAHQFTRTFAVFWAFVALCCCASAIYIINDLCDLDSDRRHPTKRKRPFASCAVPLARAPHLLGGAISAALLPCLWLSPRVFLCLVAYFVTTVSYSLFFKQRLFMDVIVLAGLYVLRILIGAAAMGDYISNWLLGFAGFIFLGLALLKRSGAMSCEAGESSAKLHGRAYRPEDRPVLEGMAICSGFAAFVVVAFYIDSLQAVELYRRPALLWGICPFLVYWYGRLVLLAHRGEMDDDPVNFAVHDRASYATALLLFMVWWLAI